MGRARLQGCVFVLALASVTAGCGRDAAPDATQKTSQPAASAPATPTAPGTVGTPGSPGTPGTPAAPAAAAAAAAVAVSTSDYRIDTVIDWFHYQSTKCGGPEGEWLITVDGVRNLGGGQLVVDGSGKAVLARTPNTPAPESAGTFAISYAIRLQGVPALAGGQDGQMQGNAAFDGAILALTGTQATGTFFSQSPAIALGGSVDPLRNLQLPVQEGAYCGP